MEFLRQSVNPYLRLNGVSRMDCGRWFAAWSLLGYGYDVTLYSDWEVTFTFNIETAVVNVPEFTWQRFYTDGQLDIYRYFDQG